MRCFRPRRITRAFFTLTAFVATVLVSFGPTQGQASSSPIHATSWAVRRASDEGREIVVPEGAVMVFDSAPSFGDPTSSDAGAVYLYDGCTTSSGVFTWSDRRLSTTALRGVTDTCTTPARTSLRKALAGSFNRDPLGNVRAGAVLKLGSGRKTIELIRRSESRVRDTVWHPLGAKASADPRIVAGQIEFHATSFTANDGCNSIKGAYVEVRGRILVLGRPITTAMACETPRTGRQGVATLAEGPPPQLTTTASELILTIGTDVYRYQKYPRPPT